MTNNPTIDGVSEDPRQWSDRQILDFIGVALRNVDPLGSVVLSEIRQGFEYMLSQQPAVERQEPNYYGKIGNIISDLVAGRTLTAIAALRTIQAWESDPKPLMVTFADHKKGLGAYLEQIKALQSTIAQLQARVHELESGMGEPIYELEYLGEGGGGWVETDKHQFDVTSKLKNFRTRIVFTAPPAPVAVVLPERRDLSKKMFKEMSPSERDISFKDIGWNACLDATAALNAPKPTEWHDVAGDDEGFVS